MLYAEVFGYEEEIASLHDKVELGSRGDYDVFDIAVSDSREFISVLLYNNTRTSSQEDQIKGFVLDFRKFSKTKERDDLLV